MYTSVLRITGTFMRSEHIEYNAGIEKNGSIIRIEYSPLR